MSRVRFYLFALLVVLSLWITCSQSVQFDEQFDEEPHLFIKGKPGKLFAGKRMVFRRKKNFFIRSGGKTTVDCRRFCKRNVDGSLAGRTCAQRGPRSRVFCRICRSTIRGCGKFGKDVFS